MLKKMALIIQVLALLLISVLLIMSIEKVDYYLLVTGAAIIAGVVVGIVTVLATRSAKKQPVVYISHSSKDKKLVERLIHDMEKLNVEVVFPEKIVHVGDDYKAKIKSEFGKVDFFILLLSKEYVDSDFGRFELTNAINSGKKVFPLKTEAEVYTPPEISNLQHLQIDDDSYQKSIHALMSSLHSAYKGSELR